MEVSRRSPISPRVEKEEQDCRDQSRIDALFASPGMWENRSRKRATLTYRLQVPPACASYSLIHCWQPCMT
eukprot:6649-Eustigmatos_ZCMA.PRE.1